MRIALDATYSVDPRPTGIGIYSNELLLGLADAYKDDEFLHCFRLKQFARASGNQRKNIRKRLLVPPLPTFGADIFHALNQRVDRRPARAVVATFHDLFVMTEEYSSPEFRTRFTEQAQRAARNSDLIITVSEFTAGQVSSLLAFDRSRIRVVPHGVRPPAPFLDRRREKIILFVGALQTRKNIVRLVEAFERLPADWRLILAGAKAGYGVEQILARIDESNCRDRIRMTGYAWPAELDTLYARAAILAFPSLDEGFGIPVLEGMAHGVPVVASNRPAIREVAEGAAILVDPRNTDDLQQALAQLIADPDLREEYTALGRKRAALYPWERAIRATYSVYRELAN